jgi:hypothetical protein
MLRFPLAVLIIVAMLAGLTISATAQDVDCADLTYEEAQDILAEDPSDPSNLDPDDDGVACESSPSGGDDESSGSTETDAESESTLEPGSGSGDLGSGGIGLTPKQLETRNGVTDCEEFEEVNAAACPLDAEDEQFFVYYLLTDDQDTGLQRLVATALGESLEVAEQLARLFLPNDAVLTDTGSAPNGNAIQFWESDWLAEQLGHDDAIWGAYAPGTVYVQFVPDDADEPESDNIAYVEISVPAAEYDIVETETVEAPNGRTRFVMSVVMDPAASYIARYTALEEIIRLGYEDQQNATVIIVFAVSDESEVGAGADVGRAAVSRDGEGLDPSSDNLPITEDDGQIQIAVAESFANETVYFAAKE